MSALAVTHISLAQEERRGEGSHVPFGNAARIVL
jgi:hypothetical protein